MMQQVEIKVEVVVAACMSANVCEGAILVAGSCTYSPPRVTLCLEQ